MKLKRYLKNINIRKNFKKTEVLQRVFKFIYIYLQSRILKIITQYFFFKSFLLSFFKTRIKNFCIVSGRSRGVYRKFKVSRIVFKCLGETGLFFGLQKLS